MVGHASCTIVGEASNAAGLVRCTKASALVHEDVSTLAGGGVAGAAFSGVLGGVALPKTMYLCSSVSGLIHVRMEAHNKKTEFNKSEWGLLLDELLNPDIVHLSYHFCETPSQEALLEYVESNALSRGFLASCGYKDDGRMMVSVWRRDKKYTAELDVYVWWEKHNGCYVSKRIINTVSATRSTLECAKCNKLIF